MSSQNEKRKSNPHPSKDEDGDSSRSCSNDECNENSSSQQQSAPVKVGIGGNTIQEEEDKLLSQKDVLYHRRRDNNSGADVAGSVSVTGDEFHCSTPKKKKSVVAKILAIDPDDKAKAAAANKSASLNHHAEEEKSESRYAQMKKAESIILASASRGANTTPTSTETTSLGALQVFSSSPSPQGSHAKLLKEGKSEDTRLANVTEPYQLDASEDVDLYRLVVDRAAEARHELGESGHHESSFAEEILSRVPSQPTTADAPLDDSQETQPGAYAEGHGAVVRRRNHMLGEEPISVEDLTETGSIVVGANLQQEEDVTERTLGSVVEARPVDEDDEEGMLAAAVSAQPYDTKAALERKWGLRLRFFCLILFSIVIVGGVVLGSVLGTTRERGGDADNSNSLAGSSSSSAADSVSSSSSDTQPPYSRAELILSSLPEYTLESLKNPLSPQSEAYEWLTNHQDIQTMEIWRMKQLFALSCFYFSFDGPNWPFRINGDWLDDSRSECDWFSILFGTFPGMDGIYQETSIQGGLGTCNEEGKFITLHMTGPPKKFITYRIENATMPKEIALLTSLQTIKLTRHTLPNNTTLEDLFPLELAQNLNNLTTLDLRDNNLLGSIPNYIMTPRLTEFSLPGNQLTGSIPTQIGLLQDLQDFDIQRNRNITGELPWEEIGLLTNLKKLEISKTSISGAFPTTELSLLTNLERLDISQTQMSGSLLPSEIGLLSSLQSLDASSSSSSTIGAGVIPTQIGLLSNLTILNLSNNTLSGTIPKELGNCTHIQYLDLSHNHRLTGNVPSQLGRLTGVVEVWLEDLALLTGTIPIEVALLAANHSLRVLNLNQTSDLRGTVPTELCELQQETCSYFPVFRKSKKKGPGRGGGRGGGRGPSSSDSLDEEDMEPCALAIDCSEQLCGCGCPC